MIIMYTNSSGSVHQQSTDTPLILLAHEVGCHPNKKEIQYLLSRSPVIKCLPS